MSNEHKDNAPATPDLSTEQPHPNRPSFESGEIGPYRILETLGEGGMGTVYLAEQREPVRRRVALKLIKLGMDTREVIARFESERQALALMNHPNVAAVYDAGAMDSGRPYFVMEHVAGEPITAYCDRHRLSIRERLELFTQVCDAIQHAHQKGIIHRDLKPSNVLVTSQSGRPVPKVIDFGVAKAINQRLTEHTIFTEQGRLLGTPEYMSPEQAEMTSLDVDTRTDIYSLGVTLYELLTGKLPFDSGELRRGGYAAIQRMIRELDPPKPSTRVTPVDEETSTVAERRRLEPRTLNRVIRGELDWIVMKCLEKDRSRRYDTPSAITREIRCYLDGVPVSAGPPSASYRFWKFVQRNRAPVLATAAFVSLLLLATVALGFTAAWAMKQRERAEGALERERQAHLEEKRQRDILEATQDEMIAQLKEWIREKVLIFSVANDQVLEICGDSFTSSAQSLERPLRNLCRRALLSRLQVLAFTADEAAAGEPDVALLMSTGPVTLSEGELVDYEFAESLLIEADGLLERYAQIAVDIDACGRLQMATVLARLYEVWHAAEPLAGKDVDAARCWIRIEDWNRDARSRAQALVDAGRFAEAERLFKDRIRWVAKFEAIQLRYPTLHHETLEDIIAFYSDWHAAAPHEVDVAASARWRQQLERINAQLKANESTD